MADAALHSLFIIHAGTGRKGRGTLLRRTGSRIFLPKPFLKTGYYQGYSKPGASSVSTGSGESTE